MTQQTKALHPLDITLQLDDFRDMQDGWLDGDGFAPSHAGIDWLIGMFSQHYLHELPLPHIYPTPQGGIRAEWSLSHNEVSIEIDLQNHTAEWHLLNVNTHQSEIQELNLDEDHAWDWTTKKIRQLSCNHT